MSPLAEDRAVELLQELLDWTRFAHRGALADTLRDVLSDPRHFKAYAKTDGKCSQREVANAAGLSQPAISNLWTRWRKLGIVREAHGRVQHLVNPEDIGLEAP